MPIAAPLPMPWAGKWADAVPDPDADLLRRYAAERDSAAFAVLVRRHGPLVFGVCLRAAGHRSDAEDAFQAVFLILAQKVGQLTRPELLGNWLYGVAYRVARKARRTAHRRRIREAVMADVPHPASSLPTAWSDLSPVLDDELARLAEHYRSAVLLCDVQGLSRTDAAKRLGIPEGTLSSRLNAGRKKLADRLTKRGITLGAAGVVLFLADHATAAVPDVLTGRLAELVARAANGEVVGGVVGELTREGITMRLKLWAGLAALGLGATGVAFAAWPGDDKPKVDPPPKAVKADDPKADEKGKQVASGRKRARLLHTRELNDAATGLVWMPNGKQLLMIEEKGISVLPINPSAETAKIEKIEWLALPPRLRFTGIAPDGSGPMTISTSGGRVNVENAIQFWKFQPAPKQSNGIQEAERKTISLDVEPSRILGATADGKHLIAEVVKPIPASGEPNNPNPNVNDWDKGARLSLRFVRIDTQTGDVSGEIAKFDDPESLFVASAVGKSADRLFVQLHTRNETVYRAIDTATGKTVWEKTFEKTPFLRDSGQLIASTDGTSLFVRQSEFLAPQPLPQRGGGARGGGGPLGGFGGGGMAVGGYNLNSVSGGWLINGRPASMQIPMVLDAKTGDLKKTIEMNDVPFANLEAVSPDSKLAIGEVSAPRPPANDNDRGGGWGGVPGGFRGESVGMAVQRLVVWNTATGKAVKEWDLGGQKGSIFAAFAPDRPVLAIAEVQYTRVYSKDEKGNQTSDLKYTTIVGLWDVSGLSD